MLTFDNILQLTAAGYTKAEILAMSNAAKHQKKEPETEAVKQPTTSTTDSIAEFTEVLKAFLAQKLEQKPEEKPEQKPEQKPDADMIRLLQAMNVQGQRYDLPPKYDVQDKLDVYFAEMMGGEKKGEKINE